MPVRRVNASDPAPATSAATGARAADRSGPSGGRRLATAAALIAVLTVLSRIIGFVRTLVLGHVAGSNTSITGAYLTANLIPNIVFEIVAGGALAALVVPLIAGPIVRGDRDTVARTTSALLTWVLAILVPLACVVALAAHPIVALLIERKVASPDAIDAGTRMLRIFASQIPLYGIGIVLAGVLQAHRRFAWPVLAPLLSSVVVIGTYVAYGVLAPHQPDLPHVSRAAQLVLAIGTTTGVVVLSLCLVIPARRLRMRLRPTWRFEGDARAAVGGLAAVGIITVAAQQLSLAYAIYLANRGAAGSIYAFTLAQTIYLVPWAVLAVPVATSVYPELASTYATGDEPGYRRTLAGATRTTLMLCALGAAAMVAVAVPAARVFSAVTQAAPTLPGQLAPAIAAYAPGLVGYGLFALHSRALYARGQNRYAAVATIIGWGAVIVASGGLAVMLSGRLRVTALASANSVGMTVLAVVLCAIVYRRTGRDSLRGVARATVAGVLAALGAIVAGIAVRTPFGPDPGLGGDLLQGMLSGVVTVLVFGALAALVDRRDVRPLVVRLSRFVDIGRPGRSGRSGRSGRHNERRDNEPATMEAEQPASETGAEG